MEQRSSNALELYSLHAAARDGRLDDLKSLLSSGGGNLDVNCETYGMLRPLHEACSGGHYECALLLHQYGAGVNLRDIDGATPLNDACAKGSLECIRFLLENGAYVNPPFVLISPLHEAVWGNNWHCLPLLIHHGANLEASDLEFGSPLQMAVKKGFVECATILLQAGANANATKAYQTPLHDAASVGDASLVELLLEHGANLHVKNWRDLTALDLVPHDYPVCKVLLEVWKRTPNSLRHMCRLKIRKAVGRDRMQSMAVLRLPRILMRFLEYD